MNEIVIKNDIDYVKCGDYYLPNLEVSTDKTYTIGKYGRLHAKFIKEHHPCRYSAMMIQGTWLDYLEKVDNMAKSEVERLVKDISDKAGISEELKATDQMKWVGLKNNAKAQAEEIVYRDIVYSARRNF